jgi:hypothetical protein
VSACQTRVTDALSSIRLSMLLLIRNLLVAFEYGGRAGKCATFLLRISASGLLRLCKTLPPRQRTSSVGGALWTPGR